MSRYCLFLLTVILACQTSLAQSAELAKTPPMGWNSWNKFNLKINDAGIRAQAAALVKSGMKQAGYEYIVIDGGWEGPHDAQGVFHSDPERFPDMKALCDYIHSLGLKAGIHTSPGPTTCAGREASYGHEKQDAETFARWGMDFVKYDWCSGGEVYPEEQMPAVYKKMSEALAATGRPMVYSLSVGGRQSVWKWGASVGGHMWRTTGDIQDKYTSMLSIALRQNGLEKYAGPGHWNDPDMLEVGNGGMNQDEYRTHMGLWCILAAPLFAGNDLTKMSPTTLDILTNSEVIAVDQDPAGIQGHRAWQEGPAEVWTKAMADGSTALIIFNMHHPITVTVKLKELGLPESVQARDLWARKDIGTVTGSITVSLPKHGSVLWRVKPAAASTQPSAR